MLPGADGLPDPSTFKVFDQQIHQPADLKEGPGGALYYVDLGRGEIQRVSYIAGNQPPEAVATATPSNGPSPLEVELDASGSTDADAGDTLSYAWDLDGDGEFDDSTAVSPTHIYAEPGVHTASVQVTDNHGATKSPRPKSRSTTPRRSPKSPRPTRALPGRSGTRSISPGKRPTPRRARSPPPTSPGA